MPDSAALVAVARKQLGVRKGLRDVLVNKTEAGNRETSKKRRRETELLQRRAAPWSLLLALGLLPPLLLAATAPPASSSLLVRPCILVAAWNACGTGATVALRGSTDDAITTFLSAFCESTV